MARGHETIYVFSTLIPSLSLSVSPFLSLLKVGNARGAVSSARATYADAWWRTVWAQSIELDLII